MEVIKCDINFIVIQELVDTNVLQANYARACRRVVLRFKIGTERAIAKFVSAISKVGQWFYTIRLLQRSH